LGSRVKREHDKAGTPTNVFALLFCSREYYNVLSNGIKTRREIVAAAGDGEERFPRKREARGR
jgi:hypothetical protein